MLFCQPCSFFKIASFFSGGAGRGPRLTLAEMAGVERDYFASTDEPELEFDDDGTELSSAKEGWRATLILFWTVMLMQ